ncbi:MAG: hypothetical protein KC656_27950, partial [Myxococcales bacterium]|nr:hypothetical protein [Myxococcales bacterium]
MPSVAEWAGMVFEHLDGVITAVVGGVGIVVGRREYRTTREVMQAEKARELADRLQADALAGTALRMLDWVARTYEVPGEGPTSISSARVAGALATKDRYDPDEVLVRDAFERLCDELVLVESSVASGLVQEAHVQRHFGYWLAILGAPERNGHDAAFRDRLWEYVERWGYRDVQDLCRRFGYEITPPVELRPGDVVLTRGTSWVSRLIRVASRVVGESRTQVNHVGVLATGGSLGLQGLLRGSRGQVDLLQGEPEIVEALARVVQHPFLPAYANAWSEVAVFRCEALTDEERAEVVRRAGAYVGRRYGYLQLVAHFLDWLLQGAFVFRRLTSTARYPICSWLVAHAYKGIDDFGTRPGGASPDDIW